jgi:hypothetical protein
MAIPQGVKRPGREVGHSPLSSTEDEKDGAVPPLPHIGLLFMIYRLINEAQGQLHFYQPSLKESTLL